MQLHAMRKKGEIGTIKHESQVSKGECDLFTAFLVHTKECDVKPLSGLDGTGHEMSKWLVLRLMSLTSKGGASTLRRSGMAASRRRVGVVGERRGTSTVANASATSYL